MTTAREQAESMKADLQQIRDEIRVKMHLASMDLKDRLQKLEPEMKAFEHRAEEVTEEVGDELHEGWNHLKTALKKIRDELASKSA